MAKAKNLTDTKPSQLTRLLCIIIVHFDRMKIFEISPKFAWNKKVKLLKIKEL